MPEEMKQVPIDLSHVFELLSNKKNDILDIDYSNDNDSYPTVRAVKNYVDDLQTILDSKASIDSVNNLGSALNSNLNTIYSFINHVTTDKVYDKGNLTNIGTTPHSTQELVNNKIDEKLGDLNEKIFDLSELELIDSTHSSASTSNWTGTSTRLTSLTKGTRILYRLTYVPTSRSQGASLSIQFTNNTHSGFKPIMFFNNSTLTSRKWFVSSIAKNDVLLLEYDGTNWVLLDFFAIGERPNVARTGSYNDLSDKPTIVDNLNSTSSTSVLSAKQGKELKTLVDGKQATLVSGTSIKTVNNESLLGSGNINISSGSNVDIVTAWESTLSDNKVTSEKLVKNSLDTKYSKNNIVTISSTNTIDLDDYTTSDFYIFAPINMLQYVSNAPSDLDDSVFYLFVERRDNNYAKQTLTSKMGVTWVRTKISNTGWNNWKQIIDTDDASTTAPIGNRVNTSATTGSSTKYARADHSHTLTQFKCNGTTGSNGYIKVFQIKINTTYQDSPISFSLMQRGTKQSAEVNIRFANENSNDPTLDSFTFNGNNIGNNGEYYLYKESSSTWSFIVRKWDTHDVINIYNMNTTNNGISVTSLNTQVSELPSGCIPASMVRNDLFFKTKNGSTSNYMNLFEIRPTGDYQAKPITFEIVRNTKPTPIYVSVRLTNVTLASNTYAPQTIWSWGTSDTPVYIRKEADNVFNVIMYHLANEEISVCNMNNPNQSVKITPLGTVYGTDVPVTSGDNQVWKDTYTVGGTTFGTGTNNVVRGNDSRLSDTRNPKSTKISAGSDLNTYTTTGFYYNNTNTDCATITPLPQPNKAFFLQVEDWGTSNYTKQTITHYDPVKTYERIRNTRTWTDWHELQHNDGTGGENLLRTEPNNEGNSGVNYTIADETFHNDKVYYRNETSKDTTKYSGWTWAIPRNEFDYGDVFTLSFYAKGTIDAEIRTYFAGASGYISNRRLSSNSDVDGDRVIGSYGDGATRFHLTSDWKRYYVTYQLHSTATTPTQNKSIHIRTLGASTDIEFYISNVKLERGYYATDYDRRTRDNEPLYFPTEVSLPATTTSANRRKFIHPPYKFKNIPNWTVEGEIKVTGNSARFELHKTDDTNLKNFIAVGKNGSGYLAYWWGTSGSAESSKTYSASDIEVDTWYPFRISRMGDNVLFMFNNDYKHEVTTTYFNTFEDIEPLIFGYGTSGASVRNLKITPLEPVHPLSPNSSVCTNAQGIITTESKNNHAHSDTQLNWNGDATNNSISPLLMATDSEFGANRLAYFPSSRIKVEYSTDGGSTWNELTTGNYSEENKTKLVTTASQYMFLGNNSTTDYSKNSLRITFDVGDMNADSILYLVTRKIALFTGTANSTGFTCRIQTQTYAQYNTNSGTFSNYGSAFTLGGWSGWNTAPLDIILGGYKSSNQTNSSSERIKALRLLFTQTGGTGNGFVAKVRLYGETAHKTASQYANNNHIYTINENQDATFPSKIIKEGGTSSQFLMANGDVQNKVTSWSNTPSDVNIPSEKLVKTEINSIQETIGSNSPQIMKVEYIERQYQNTSGRQLVIQVTCDVPITRGNIVANSNDGANTSIKTLSGSDNMMICTFGIYDANESDTFNITLKNNNGVITDTYSFSYTFSGNNNYWVDTGYVNDSYSIRNEIDLLKNGLTNILQYKKVASFQDNKIRVFANSFSGCIFINGTFTVAANNVTTLCTIPSQYKPPNPITLPCNESQTTYNYISIWTTDGKVNLRNRGSGTSVSAYNIVYYPLRDTIGV